MSSLQERIEEALLAARKAGRSSERSVLSVLLGEIQNLQNSRGQKGKVTDIQVVRVIRKLVSSNQETLEHLKPGMEMFNRLSLENLVLEGFLPQLWTKEQILGFLQKHKDLLCSQKSHGQATGIAVKLLNLCPVEGQDVASVVADIRNST